MRYWVYINDKVDGPYEEDKLVTLQGFTPDTLICSEEVPEGGNQEWVKASTIFEFDQVEQPADQPLPAEEVFKTQTVHNDPLPSEQTVAPTSDVNHLLLEKIDFLTREISGLQTKLDDMKIKLDAAISSAHFASQPTADTPAYIPPQDNAQNTITLTRHDENPVTSEALITNTESLVSQAENIVAAANQAEKPLDMLGPVDLGDKKADAATTEVSLGSKAEEEVVLRSALDSLYNAKVQTQEEKESTFQDLLTPKQAEVLAAQATALNKEKEESARPTLDEALKTVMEADKAAATAENEAEKDALLKELTAEPKEDVLDQVIKEKEAEKQAETLRMEQAAAAGAAAGVAAAAGLASLDEKKEQQHEVPGFETVQEVAAEPLPEKQTLDFTAQAEPALSIAPDRHEPEKQEEVKPASEMPADVPAAKKAEEPKETAPLSDLPVLEEVGAQPQQAAAAAPEQDKKEETMQELVPGAKMEKPDGVIITDEDLNEAFSERKEESAQSVEQLFGLTPESQPESQPAAEEQQPQTAEEEQHLPQFSDQTTEKPLPMGNPNDLTEIELKEGSTYLISDFVPPAQTNGNALPKELESLNAGSSAKHPADGNTQTAEVQEMVASVKQDEKPAAENEAPKDVTVSQIILENTIKTKRGATLDIKTVPMVPEPAQSERLHFDDMSDDINTQHDMKSADVKANGKTAKMVVGTLVTLVLAAGIYVMLAFMNLIPPQFNLLSSDQSAAQTAEQNAQLEEMLGTQPQQQPAAAPETATNPMDATLTEVKNFPLMNGYTLQQYIEARHPAAKGLITWDISTAVDPDNYSILVKVPPENPQSFKISYRFNYNTVTKALDPTISDAKNLLDSVSQSMGMPLPQQQVPAQQMQPAQQQPAPQQAPTR